MLVPLVVWLLLLQDRDAMETTRTTQAFELLTLREARESAEPDEETPDEDDPFPDRRRQHVALPAPEREERPDDADFADQYERRVERETVSPDDEFAPPEPTTTPPAAAEPAPSESRPPAAPERRTRDREQARETEARESIEAVAEDTPDQPRERAAQDAREGADDADDEAEAAEAPTHEGPRVDFRAFNPTLDDVGEMGEARPRRQDYLDLPEGERTEINSIQSMYWSFFMRMREALLREWNPQRQLRLHDPTLALYGRRDRITVLEVTLNSDGSLRHAIISRSSELDFLDQEAIRAFQAAQPFPNVPEGLKDERGHATLRFSFIVSFERNISRLRWEF